MQATKKQQELTEAVAHASVSLGIEIVKDIAKGALMKNPNLDVRSFIKILDRYESERRASLS